MTTLDDRTEAPDRFSTALYTVGEAARYLDVPASTLTAWAHGYHRHPHGQREVVGAPILTTLPRPEDKRKGAAARVQRKAPVRLTSRLCCQASRG